MKNVIVTGATSFIGIALLKLLYKRNIAVTAIIRPNSSRKGLLKSQLIDCEIVECELDKIASVELSKTEYDAIFHIGWSSDFENSRYNLNGQLKNVEYCKNVIELGKRYNCKKILSVGSQAECGLVDKPISSLTNSNPQTAYAEAKCIAFDECRKLSATEGIQLYWPRLLSAYGPYDRNSTMIMACINACKNKEIMSLTPAEQIWDYVYIDKVAEALLAIIEKGKAEKKYSIASGIGRPLKEYISIVSDVMEFPQLLSGIGMKDYVANQVMYLVGDVRELYEDTGVIMQYDFKNGINNILSNM